MKRFRGLSRGARLVLALAVGGAVFGVATAVQASIPDASGVAHGCYYVPPKLGGTQQLPGDLRLIDTDKGQHCNSDEASVALAPASDVQHSQLVFTFGTFSINGTGQATVNFTCGSSAWVATAGSIAVTPGQPLNTITQIDSYNVGGLANSATNGFGADSDWRIHFNYTQANVQFHPLLECVLADHVYGNAYGTAPSNGAAPANPTPTVHVQLGQQS